MSGVTRGLTSTSTEKRKRRRLRKKVKHLESGKGSGHVEAGRKRGKPRGKEKLKRGWCVKLQNTESLGGERRGLHGDRLEYQF